MYFFHLQLVCEEVNVDRFYPVLYPKVVTNPHYQIPLSLLLTTNTTSLWTRLCSPPVLWSSGIKVNCDLWRACDQQQLQVWGYLSKVWPGECASEIPLLIFAFEVMCHSGWKCPLLPSRRHQRKSCLGTWKKVLPLSSSWSFWATRLSFMTLKGLDTFKFNLFEFFQRQI